MIEQGGAVEARWAHNPKVEGSKPSPAIYRESTAILNNKHFYRSVEHRFSAHIPMV